MPPYFRFWLLSHSHYCISHIIFHYCTNSFFSHWHYAIDTSHITIASFHWHSQYFHWYIALYWYWMTLHIYMYCLIIYQSLLSESHIFDIDIFSDLEYSWYWLFHIQISRFTLVIDIEPLFHFHWYLSLHISLLHYAITYHIYWCHFLIFHYWLCQIAIDAITIFRHYFDYATYYIRHTDIDIDIFSSFHTDCIIIDISH